MHLCVLRGSQNKQRLFLYTALTYRFLKPRQRVFTARYEMGLKSDRYSFVLKGLNIKDFSGRWVTTCQKTYTIIIVIIIIIYTKDWTSLIRSVSRVTTVLANVSSVFQLFSFLVVCSDMISTGYGFVAFFASVNASSVCIHLSCLVCL